MLIFTQAAWGQAGAPPAQDTQLPGAQTPTPKQPNAQLAAPREVPSAVNTGAGLWFEPIYWRSSTSASIRQGTLDAQVDPGNFKYPGSANKGLGARVSVPIGKNGTLRVSYFRNKNAASTTAATNLNLFRVQVTKGDPIEGDYKMESFKASYDYLTYFWRGKNSEVRVKTLYEVQRFSFTNNLVDFTPFDLTTDPPTFTLNPASGTLSVFLPTFGVGLEQTVSRHFRWEAKASGFGLYHGPDIVDSEALIAYRISHYEITAGARYFHWKTNPKKEHYNVGSTYGPFVSLRYYWKKQ